MLGCDCAGASAANAALDNGFRGICIVKGKLMLSGSDADCVRKLAF